MLTRVGESLKHGDPKAQASRHIDKENLAGHRDSPGMGQFTAISRVTRPFRQLQEHQASCQYILPTTFIVNTSQHVIKLL
jgi:hypothetical protein